MLTRDLVVQRAQLAKIVPDPRTLLALEALFQTAQETRSSDRVRKEEQREREAGRVTDVTSRHQSSPAVTDGHSSLAVPSSAVQDQEQKLPSPSAPQLAPEVPIAAHSSTSEDRSLHHEQEPEGGVLASRPDLHSHPLPKWLFDEASAAITAHEQHPHGGGCVYSEGSMCVFFVGWWASWARGTWLNGAHEEVAGYYRNHFYRVSSANGGLDDVRLDAPHSRARTSSGVR